MGHFYFWSRFWGFEGLRVVLSCSAWKMMQNELIVRLIGLNSEDFEFSRVLEGLEGLSVVWACSASKMMQKSAIFSFWGFTGDELGLLGPFKGSVLLIWYCFYKKTWKNWKKKWCFPGVQMAAAAFSGENWRQKCQKVEKSPFKGAVLLFW